MGDTPQRLQQQLDGKTTVFDVSYLDQVLAGHPRHRAEIVVRLHHVAEAGLVLRRHDVDRHLRKNHHGFPAPTVASWHLYQGVDRKSGIAVKSLSGGAESSKHKSALSRISSWL